MDFSIWVGRPLNASCFYQGTVIIMVFVTGPCETTSYGLWVPGDRWARILMFLSAHPPEHRECSRFILFLQSLAQSLRLDMNTYMRCDAKVQ